MSSGPRLDDDVRETARAVAALEGGRYEEVEVFAKKGRSRRVAIDGDHVLSVMAQERGWAVRASDRRSSFFATGTGEPPPGGPWPEADGLPFRLPDAELVPEWHEPSDFETPLLSEREGTALFEGISRALSEELPGARLLQGALEDGASEVQLLNRRGIEARHRSRLAALHLEAAGPGRPGPVTRLYLAEREARRFRPLALARRLVDRLTVLAQGKPCERDRGELLLAPPVMIALLDALSPLLIGPEASRRAAEAQGSRLRLASEAWTVVDNGRLPGGVFEAPIDGEGMATRETVLLEQGNFRQPLLAWWQCRDSHLRGAGCCRRPSFRDLPEPGPTHLYLRPQGGVSVADLLGQISRGYYLLDTAGPGRFVWDENRFELPVCGFEVRGGRAAVPMAGSKLTGSFTALLQGLAAVGRDLSFLPLRGMIGSPSVLVTGLELNNS